MAINTLVSIKDGENTGKALTPMPMAINTLVSSRRQRNGQGTYTYADGSKYVGEYKDGQATGKALTPMPVAINTLVSSRIDKFNGQGIKYLANGKVDKSGIWKDDDLSSQNLSM